MPPLFCPWRKTKVFTGDPPRIRGQSDHMIDPFTRLPLPSNRDDLVKFAYLACQCRENRVNLVNVGGWILPVTPLPWTPERATALRRCLHHVERCRGFLQAHSEAFPVMDRAEAERWLEDLHRHHGAGACWWSPGVRSVAEQIQRLLEG